MKKPERTFFQWCGFVEDRPVLSNFSSYYRNVFEPQYDLVRKLFATC